MLRIIVPVLKVSSIIDRSSRSITVRRVSTIALVVRDERLSNRVVKYREVQSKICSLIADSHSSKYFCRARETYGILGMRSSSFLTSSKTQMKQRKAEDPKLLHEESSRFRKILASLALSRWLYGLGL
ncbi:hypothetical protein I3843_07G081300 [Carya illinoinensis]|nr:hypothetical protein I3843_07G081300 [Carya illinoinensis]